MKTKKVKLKKTVNKTDCPGWDVSFSEDGGSIVHCDCVKCTQAGGWDNYMESLNETQ